MSISAAPADPAPVARVRPAEWCDLCSARYLRFTDEGQALCGFHWFDHVLSGWAVQCSNPEDTRRVLETLLRQARPVREERIVELVAWHPMRAVIAEERAGLQLRLRAAVHEALGELVALGVAALVEGGYAWSESARERIHGPS